MLLKIYIRSISSKNIFPVKTQHNILDKQGKKNNYFANFNEVISAYEQKQLQLHSAIWVRCPNDVNLDTPLKLIEKITLSKTTNLIIYNNLQRKETIDGELLVQYLRTTPGRIIFNQCVNDILNKAEVK